MPMFPSATNALLGIGYDPILSIHTHANEKQQNAVSGQYAAVLGDYVLNPKVLGDQGHRCATRHKPESDRTNQHTARETNP